MNPSRKRLLPPAAHLLLLLTVGVIVWQVREPGILLHQSMVWYGLAGLMICEFGPLSTVMQIVIFLAAGAVALVFFAWAILKKRPFPPAGHAAFAFMYLFPYLVSTFGKYIGE